MFAHSWARSIHVRKKPCETLWLKALPQLQGHITLFENRGHFVEEHEPAAIAKRPFKLS